MKKQYGAVLIVLIMLLAAASPAMAQPKQVSQLSAALTDMYTACLFNPDGPFSQAVALSQNSLAPGLSNFIESNLASIPLTPPGLDVEYADGKVVEVVTGFTPIYTESTASVGKGQFLAGFNVSYFNLSKIRGEELSDLAFTFEQDGGGDRIAVQMPLDISATVSTLFGTFGLTNRLDIGVALPIVRLSTTRQATTFQVLGNKTGCRYGTGCQPGQTGGFDSVDYTFAGNVSINLGADDVVELPDVPDLNAVPESSVYLGTVAIRAKYRFPSTLNAGNVAAVVDVRLPVGRNEDSVLGSGHFGTRVMLIGEYDRLDSFKPYVNLGAQFWNGDNSNSLKFATGFTQRLASKLFFAFDLLGEYDIEDPPFLQPLDDARSDGDLSEAFSLVQSTIPALDRDHTLNAGLGAQYVISPSFYLYGSALFSLLDRGLQSSVAPSFGAALYF